MPVKGLRVSWGFILCLLALPLLFFVGPALAADNTANITTAADGAYGLHADAGGAWNNYAAIVTNGSDAFGMWATAGSEIKNSRARISGTWRIGSITTNGFGSHGMVADGGSKAWNSEAIRTFGPEA